MDSERDIAIRLIRLLSLEDVRIELERLKALIQTTEFVVGWHDYFIGRLSIRGNTALWDIVSCEMKIGDDWIKGKLSRGNNVGDVSYRLVDEFGKVYVVGCDSCIRGIELKEKENLYE